MRTLPELVLKLCYTADAWIVGGAATPSDSPPRDYDVCVPFRTWADAALHIPCDAVPNTFGGWKCVSEGCVVDVWPGDLSLMMTYAPLKVVWHPKSGKRFTQMEMGA